MTIPGFFTPAWCPSWTAALINHLWQSTAVVLVAWLLTLLLRANPARVRYAIWMIASIKFLVPFALLSSLGALWARPNPSPQTVPSLYVVVEEMSQPFHETQAHGPLAIVVNSHTHSIQLTSTLFAAAWLSGFLAMVIVWTARWRRAAGMVRSAEPISSGRELDALRLVERKIGIKKPILLVRAPGETEPGVFGVRQPVLLWPLGLSGRLDDAQIEAIMSHEVEHVCRRDNLSAAIHALIEAIFWFHPLVRWMSTKLTEERERACDERVIERNARPETYAESILKVCEFCLEPLSPCISGVSGADLKERILHIMSKQYGAALSFWRKAILALAATMVLAAPVGIGMLHGQSTGSTGAGAAQSSGNPADLPKYDVSSIKPYKAGDGRVNMMLSPDGVSLHGVPMRMLLPEAFGVEEDRILGEPAWAKSNRYDIEAKVAPEDAPKLKDLKVDQRNAMMLQLLVDRFNLKYHHEKRELPMYALVVAKDGLKMKPTKPDPDPDPSEKDAQIGGAPKAGDGQQSPMGRHMLMMHPGHLESTGTSTEMLAHLLSRQLSRTVVDKTGLSGEYDFTLDYTPDNMPMPPHGASEGGPKPEMQVDPGGPSIFTAVEEQLGLKLEATKGMVDVIVIDHIDLPTEN
jgi:bla regulator protein blaR1